MAKPHDKEIGRRLLLSKDFYSRACDYSRRAATIDRIVAIHHFHVAVEITVKAILTHYDIRGEKELNIDFESMLSQVGNFEAFKKSGQKLRYRQELRNLNQARNLAQHHAVPPEPGTLEYWDTACRRFLEDTFQVFFGLDFWELSRSSYIENEVVRQLIEKSKKLVNDGKIEKSTYPIGVAFRLASSGLYEILPDGEYFSPFFIRSRFLGKSVPREISDTFGELCERIDITDHHLALVASGVSLKSIKRLDQILPRFSFSEAGHPRFNNPGKLSQSESEARWAQEFITDCVLQWQDQGLQGKISEKQRNSMAEFFAWCDAADGP